MSAPKDAAEAVDEGWVEYGGELIWAVGFTPGGAPFGLSAEEFGADPRYQDDDDGPLTQRTQVF